MKALRQFFFRILFVIALSIGIRAQAADDHLKDSLSPLLIPVGQQPGKMDGVWVPDTFGGVTGAILDLDQVGTKKMLCVRFRTSDEPTISEQEGRESQGHGR